MNSHTNGEVFRYRFVHIPKLVDELEMLDVLVPDEDELALALRLQDREEPSGAPNSEMRARRLDAGETSSLAVAIGERDDHRRTITA